LFFSIWLIGPFFNIYAGARCGVGVLWVGQWALFALAVSSPRQRGFVFPSWIFFLVQNLPPPLGAGPVVRIFRQGRSDLGLLLMADEYGWLMTRKSRPPRGECRSFLVTMATVADFADLCKQRKEKPNSVF